MKYIWSILLLAFACSCHKNKSNIPVVDEVKPLQCQELSRVAYQITDELHEIGHYQLCKSFLCEDMKQSSYEKKYVIQWYSQEFLELEEGRDLIVFIVDSVLDKLNNGPMQASAMSPTPIGVKNLHIVVELESFYAKYVDPLFLGRIELRNGTVYYYAYSALDFETVVFQRHLEPYSTAKMIARVKNDVEQGHEDDVLHKDLTRKEFDRPLHPITPKGIRNPNSLLIPERLVK